MFSRHVFTTCFHGCFHAGQLFQQNSGHGARGGAWRSASTTLGCVLCAMCRWSSDKKPSNPFSLLAGARQGGACQGAAAAGAAHRRQHGPVLPRQHAKVDCPRRVRCLPVFCPLLVHCHLLHLSLTRCTSWLWAGGRPHYAAAAVTLLQPQAPRFFQRQCHRHHAPA